MRYEKEYLQKKIQAIADDMQTLVRPYFNQTFEVIWYGAYEIDAKHLVFWICVPTDKIKKELTANTVLNNELRALLEKHDYPAEARPRVYIGYESQETVTRESKGNWYHHFK